MTRSYRQQAACAGIVFAPVSLDDFPLLREWLSAGHVRAWWGEPDRELALIEETLTGADPTRGFVIRLGGAPVGYAQVWTPALYPQEGWTRGLSPDTRAIDIFIGARAGLGHGARILRAFAAQVFARGASRVLVDPDPANVRAIRAYEKAGFRRLGAPPGVEGRIQLMALSRAEFEETECPN